MKTFNTLLTLLFAVLLSGVTASAQLNSFTFTTLSSAATASDTVVVVASATNITAGSPGTGKTYLYVLDPGAQMGELMPVTSVNGTRISVQRASGGTPVTAHISGAIVFVQTANMYENRDRTGACTLAATKISPSVNVLNGNQWLCSTATGTWVPGWNNPGSTLAPVADFALAAGANVPPGPLFRTSTTSAVTSWTLPAGFASGGFCTLPTAAYTTTTAGNIIIASTAVVGKTLCFTYNSVTAKWYPSY